MQPVTPSTAPGLRSRRSSPRRPITRCSAFSRMAQVFTSTTSAPCGACTGSYPSERSLPYISSESLTFIWQP